LAAGSFYVRLACPKDYKASRQHDASHVRINPTTQISEVFELSVDHSVKDMSAGCYKPPVVEGVVFSDRNTNSNQEAGTLRWNPRGDDLGEIHSRLSHVQAKTA